MEMWVSRYALTSGAVKKMEGRQCADPRYFQPVDRYDWYTIGRDAHATEEAARAAAESMRVKKIASLRKQIAKLEGMKF